MRNRFETAAEGEWMITLDHVGFAVADYKRSMAFYEKALAPLGMTLLIEFSGAAARVRQRRWRKTVVLHRGARGPCAGAAAHCAEGRESGASGRLPRRSHRGRRDRQRRTRRASDLPPRLLRRLRPRSRRQQHRGRLPPSPAFQLARGFLTEVAPTRGDDEQHTAHR